MSRLLTIGITTRNRPTSLRACLDSLALVGDLSPEVLVFDDGSDTPVAEQIAEVANGMHVRVLTDASRHGYIAGRNLLVREASGEFVLLLDDDARLLTGEAIVRGVDVMRSDPRVGAVGFAQGEADGRPWPATMQPSTANTPALVPSFIGFAHLVRRDVFLHLGGYREQLGFYGEEKDFCLRLLHRGWLTVYLPDALVAHVPDQASRDSRRYLRFVARNDCLNTLYNDPITRAIWVLPARIALYFRMRRAWKIHDPWGWAWLLRELAAQLPSALAQRDPVSRPTLTAWRSLRRIETAYAAPAATGAPDVR